MNAAELFSTLMNAATTSEVEAALAAFEAANPNACWVPVGRENNRGTIEASSDPGRSLIERLTNGFDAVLETEHDRHSGRPDCQTPREAAESWLGIPSSGLSDLTPAQRRKLAHLVTIRLLGGDGRWSDRLVVVEDRGIGILPDRIPATILSLSETNKSRKKYLVGAYGQGGSSTFAVSEYTVIASRCGVHPTVGFAIVRYNEPPPDDESKIGNYVYLTLDGAVLEAAVPLESFASGTDIRHFGYDLTNYTSPLGPTSIYGLLNGVLFDPILPIWLDNQIHGYRRVIKGSRNALCGAVDEGDDERRGPTLSHSSPMFYTNLGEAGSIGIEYWVLETTEKNKRPTAAFVNPAKPIILTLHGQSHAELSQVLVRRDAELPYLRQRLICHIDCNRLTPAAKRALFVSNREDARRGQVYSRIEEEVVRALKTDDELTRLNDEARERGLRQQDQEVQREMQSEVARLLRIQGVNVDTGGGATSAEPGNDRPTSKPRGPRPKPRPLELREPPTYVRILWDEQDPIPFFADQRRYIRIETDAESAYHDVARADRSRMNFIVKDAPVVLAGTTPLKGGRMRAILGGASTGQIGSRGTLRVELARPGLPALTDERQIEFVTPPPAKPASRKVSVPRIDPRPVSPEDEQWETLGWPDNPALVASESQMEEGVLVVWYSTAFPNYANQLAAFERQDPALARSFTMRYTIWLAVHSVLLQQDRDLARSSGLLPEQDTEAEDQREQQERVRMAAVSAMFAVREVKDLRQATAAESE